MNTEECDALLIRCAKHDSEAFRQLYAQTSAKMYAICLRIVKQDQLAEDVLQEAYVKIWHSADQYTQQKGKAVTWMATVVRNKALDKLRSLKIRPQETDVSYEGEEFASHDLAPEQLAHLSDDVQQLHQCLQQLKPIQRQAILMAYYQGYTHEELSNTMQKPLGTIKAWVRRGLEKLRTCLN
ncbi:MAG: sigma-70 family RNA polymerase sigma factor [bacterium]